MPTLMPTWDELAPQQRNVAIHRLLHGDPRGAYHGEAHAHPHRHYRLMRDKPWRPADVGHVPNYAGDMNAAWRVVAHFAGRMGYDRLGYEWVGPLFKPEHRYLTAQGYPLGTTCWYVIVAHEAGESRTFAAYTPQEAICRAALWVAEMDATDAKTAGEADGREREIVAADG